LPSSSNTITKSHQKLVSGQPSLHEHFVVFLWWRRILRVPVSRKWLAELVEPDEHNKNLAIYNLLPKECFLTVMWLPFLSVRKRSKVTCITTRIVQGNLEPHLGAKRTNALMGKLSANDSNL
jgi:hypothetical protein